MNTTQSSWLGAETPLSTKHQVQRFWHTPTHEEALARIEFLVDHRRRLGILEGPSGSGKSLLLEVASRRFRGQGRRVVTLNLLGMDSAEFLWQLAVGLGANPRTDASAVSLWREIDDRVLAARYQRLDTVIACDNVEEAEADVLTLLVRLAQFDYVEDSRLTILVTTASQRRHLLGRRLLELSDLLIELEPLAETETAELVRSQLNAAACGELFTEAALTRLHELSGGIPRTIVKLAEWSLLAASAQELEQVDEETLNAVHAELTARSDPWD